MNPRKLEGETGDFEKWLMPVKMKIQAKLLMEYSGILDDDGWQSWADTYGNDFDMYIRRDIPLLERWCAGNEDEKNQIVEELYIDMCQNNYFGFGQQEAA